MHNFLLLPSVIVIDDVTTETKEDILHKIMYVDGLVQMSQ